jgi:hypothetical protein
MSGDTLARIDAIVASAARGLFASHGLPLGDAADGVADPPRDHDVAAAIGFTAPKVHGAVVVTTRKSVVARTYPEGVRDRAPTEPQICDWAGELVNQLLGRVKNALVAFGHAVDQGTPTVVTGHHLHRAPAATTVARRYSFAVEGGSVLVYLDAALADDFALSDAGNHPRPAAEGDLHLF